MHAAALRTLALVILAGLSLGASCSKPEPRVFLDSPVHGTFMNVPSVLVEGRLTRPATFASLAVNGTPVAVADNWSVTVPLDPAAVFNRINVEALRNNGELLRETATVIVGDGVSTGFVLDGDYTSAGVALRISDAGLAQIAPIVESLSTGAFDVSSLITDQNPIAEGSLSGISYTANAVEVGFGGFGLAAVPTAAGIDTTVTIDDFYIEVDLDLGFLGSCTLEIESASASIQGAYDLAPLASDPSFVDVNLVSAIMVNLSGFTSQFVSGICNDPLIGDIVNLIIGQGEIQQLMQDGFEDNLADPDGAGPLDSPLAAAIETALAGISIAGPVGEALGGNLDAPIVSVLEEATGLTILADAAFTSAGPVPGAPDLMASYTVEETIPVFGATTPVGGLPYGLSFALSTSGLNQLLKTQIENGLLLQELTELLGVPITAGLLAFFIPEMGQFDPAEAVVIRIRPTLAPVFTGGPGPAGELAELKISSLVVEAEFTSSNQTFLALEMDLDAGVDLAFTPAGLEFALATPAAMDIGMVVVENTIGASEASIVAIFQGLFPAFAPELENAIEAFPIPSLLGLDLAPVEVARLPGGFLGLFADLQPTPTTTLQNVTFDDLSSGDFQESGGCWLREWRHRLSGAAFGNTVTANMRGMLGADAGCTTNDANSDATLAYSIAFDVVSVPGEQWTLDLQHSILGALNRISDGYNDGIGFQDGGGSATLATDVVATYRLDGGAPVDFGFAPAPVSISDGVGGSSSNEDVEFSGAGSALLQGTGGVSVELDFSLQMNAFSNSNTAFPTANGDEMAIRLGKNDTIDNNFIAGGYPGMGNRNIADDGHKVAITLTSSPLP
jgi:hypothetical protein